MHFLYSDMPLEHALLYSDMPLEHALLDSDMPLEHALFVQWYAIGTRTVWYYFFIYTNPERKYI